VQFARALEDELAILVTARHEERALGVEVLDVEIAVGAHRADVIGGFAAAVARREDGFFRLVGGGENVEAF